MVLHSLSFTLALIPIFYAVGVESTICTHPAMTDRARTAFLNTQNRYRSTVAEGKGLNGNIGFTPPAANMLRMTYDCNLEAGAIAYAQTCCRKESNPKTRPGIGENIIEINKLYLSMPQVAREATALWWQELSMYGVNANMFFDFWIQKKRRVTRLTQMIWHNSDRVGCGINNCRGKYFLVVCRYSPRGNILNNFIYLIGQPCGACPAGTRCDPATSLCIV
ncbi:hypothetical protein Y032_0341g3010 [Ancylostoma ceylanicum]|uniref:SCP domain-containing protein n=1 Tax=Ancylostoma ceylanicum TaxID=53326 RepID=A0A016RY11_9BILA|nr:hypothetical protein Y032_0341g3010 [Ancylostoma ceylanicum]